MRYVVCYDIADDTRRKRVADILDAHGDRIQESVFEISASKKLFHVCLEKLKVSIDLKEDRLTVYELCLSCDRNVIYLGVAAGVPRIGEETVFIV